MALTLSIEGTGVIADCDAISDNQGGTWFELGGGSISVSTDVYFIRSASIGGKYASKSGIHAIDKGSALYDFTSGGTQEGEMVYIWVAMTAPGTLDTKANYGLCVRLSSGGSTNASSNYVDFLIAGNDDANGWDGGWRCFVIDPTKTPTRSNGTVATILANVRTIGIWIDCSSSARADTLFVNEIAIGSGLRVTGSSTAGWSDIVDYCTAYSTRGWGMWQERDGIYYTFGKTYIGGAVLGDGTAQNEVTSFSDSARVIQFGTSEYWTGSAWVSAMDVDASGIVIEDTASYDTDFTDGILVGTDQGRGGSNFRGNSLLDVSMDLYGGNNAGSATLIYDTTFYALTGAINAGNDGDHKYLGAKFIACSQFDPVGAPVIRNCLFTETDDVDAALLWNESIDVQDCNFIANTLGAGIEMPSSAGTPYDYTKLYFSGNTNDVLNSSGSAITINKAGTPASDPSTSEGSSVTFSGSVSITINVKDQDQVAIAGAQCAVYTNDATATEIINEATTAGGVADGTWSGTTPQSVKVWIRKASSADDPRYENFSQIATISSAGLTLDVTMREDDKNNATT